jgi:hypothetical protein
MVEALNMLMTSRRKDVFDGAVSYHSVAVRSHSKAATRAATKVE